METKLRIRLADGSEVEIQGPEGLVKKTMNDLPQLVSQTRKAFGLSNAASEEDLPQVHSDTVAPLEEYPSIEKPSGVQDAIAKVVATEWGKARPRTWKEIGLALKNNAIHLSNGSITGALTLMTQSGKVRRIKVGDSYGYAPPISGIQATA